MSNTRKLPAREPDEFEAAFGRELAAVGCAHCGSRRIRRWLDRRTGRYGFELLCEPTCATWRPGSGVDGHAAAAAAAERTGRLRYFAFDDGGSSGGAAVARAGG